MKILWAPWRMKYVTAPHKTAGETCLFCRAASGDDREYYIVYRSSKSYIMLNKYPYNTGHLMVVPYKHVDTLLKLDDDELLDLFKTLNKALEILEKAFRPDGFNIGVNIGRDAGAGIEEHVHIHVVPRWRGDTNFMPIVGGVKVLPQLLEETYELLLKNLK